jgi:hypothetical protein
VGLVLGGDVLHLDHEQVRLAVPVADQHRHSRRPDRGAVGPHQAQLRGVARSGEDSGTPPENFFDVVGVDHVANPVCQKPRFVVPDKVAQRAVDDPEAAVQVSQRDTDRGGGHHGSDQVLRRSQVPGVLGCLLLFSHIAGDRVGADDRTILVADR